MEQQPDSAPPPSPVPPARPTRFGRGTDDWKQEFETGGRPFRAAFEHAAIGMVVVDLHGRILKVNRSLCQVVGYSEEELLALDFQAITDSRDLPRVLDLGKQLLRGEIDHYHLEMRHVHKQGHTIWIQLSSSIVRDEAGEPCYFVGQAQDISDRKAAQEESARRVRQMERLTQTVPRILHVLETSADQDVYAEVLRLLLGAFQSEAGVVLRFADGGALMGHYLSPDEDRDSRCEATDRCDLWNIALTEGKASIENRSRPMGCGRQLTRSLVAPIRHEGESVGLVHLGDAPTDYSQDDLDLLARICEVVAPVMQARSERDKLTPREAEVMDLIVSGKTQKQIASELDISVQTAAKHRARVLEKLQVGNDVELVHVALQMRRLPVQSWPESLSRSKSGLTSQRDSS